jgi:hypothetical protein
MSKFTPDTGTLFYAETTVSLTRQVGSGNTAVVTKEKDRSYCDKVLRCVAFDDRVVVADVVYGGYGKDRRMLVRSEFLFEPLGPGIAQALGLDV